MSNTGIYVYPWDVVGDPAAAERVAGLGVSHATVAAFYHATRALTPRHPRHRVVVAERSAAYLPVGQAWSAVLPEAQSRVPGADAFGATAAALTSVGLPTQAWVVVNHVDSFDGPHVVNAYGDLYPWALCPSNESVLEYAVGLAAVVAERDDIAGIEFEAAGWYGFDHLHQHDKVAGVPLDEDEQYLFSLCFCPACCAGYREAGIDASQLRQAVRDRLDATFGGGGPGESGSLSGGGFGGAAGSGGALGSSLAEADLAAVLAMRSRVADRLREAIVREVRSQRPDPGFTVAFHATPRPQISLANTGLDPAGLPEGTTGVVVNCWNGSTANVEASVGHGVEVYAGLLGVRGMGADPDRLGQVIAEVRAAGAAGVRIYHAGLAGAADLAAIGKALAEV